MKRKTAFYIVFLASMVLLGFGAVPHHHHNGEPCVEQSHCTSNCDSDHHNTHDHNSDSDCEFCSLKQVVLTQNHYKYEPWVLDASYPGFPIDGIFLNYVDLDSREIPQWSFLVDPHKKEPSLYHHYLCRSIGLRAPPRV